MRRKARRTPRGLETLVRWKNPMHPRGTAGGNGSPGNCERIGLDSQTRFGRDAVLCVRCRFNVADAQQRVPTVECFQLPAQPEEAQSAAEAVEKTAAALLRAPATTEQTPKLPRAKEKHYAPTQSDPTCRQVPDHFACQFSPRCLK